MPPMIVKSALTLLAVALTVSEAPEAFAQTQGDIIVYEGRLKDGDKKPLGGVYPLTFSMYKLRKGGRPEWSETHFVAVDDGKYVLELGHKRPIPDDVRLDRIYMGVGVTGGAEILRTRLNPKSIRRAQPAAETPAKAGDPPVTPPVRVAKSAPKTTTTDKGVTVDYAEMAGRAIEAEHAKTADKIGDLDADALEQKLKDAVGGVKVSSKKSYSTSAGGEGGSSYELSCPKGTVVTGIRGGGGKYIDSIQLICSPLE